MESVPTSRPRGNSFQNSLNEYRLGLFHWQAEIQLDLYLSIDDQRHFALANNFRHRRSAPTSPSMRPQPAEPPASEPYFLQQPPCGGADAVIEDPEAQERWGRVLPEWSEAAALMPAPHEYRSLSDSALYARRRISCSKRYREPGIDTAPAGPLDRLALMFRGNYASERAKIENILRRSASSDGYDIEGDEEAVPHPTESGHTTFTANRFVEPPSARSPNTVNESLDRGENEGSKDSMRVHCDSSHANAVSEDGPVREFKPRRHVYEKDPRDLKTFLSPVKRTFRSHTVLNKNEVQWTELMRPYGPGARLAVKHYTLPLIEPNVSRINREHEIGHLLTHTNIAATLALFQEGSRKAPRSLNLITEYCPGGTLAAYLNTQRCNTRGTRLRPAAYAEAWCLWRQLLRGVAYMHSKNIAHCQLHPQTLQLVPHGCGAWTLRITDFSEAFDPTRSPLASSEASDSIPALAPHPINRHEALGRLVARPYRSPEVAGRLPHSSGVEGYDAFALDAWAAGTLLLALLHPRGYSAWPTPRRSDAAYRRYVSMRKPVLETTEASLRAIRLKQRDPLGCAPDPDPAPHFMGFLGDGFTGVPPDWAMIKTVLTLVDPDPTKRASVTQTLQESWVREIEVCGGDTVRRYMRGVEEPIATPDVEAYTEAPSEQNEQTPVNTSNEDVAVPLENPESPKDENATAIDPAPLTYPLKSCISKRSVGRDESHDPSTCGAQVEESGPPKPLKRVTFKPPPKELRDPGNKHLHTRHRVRAPMSRTRRWVRKLKILAIS